MLSGLFSAYGAYDDDDDGAQFSALEIHIPPRLELFQRFSSFRGKKRKVNHRSLHSSFKISILLGSCSWLPHKHLLVDNLVLVLPELRKVLTTPREALKVDLQQDGRHRVLVFHHGTQRVQVLLGALAHDVESVGALSFDEAALDVLFCVREHGGFGRESDVTLHQLQEEADLGREWEVVLSFSSL